MRIEIYRDNKHYIAKHNQRFLKGEEPYSLEVNQFADMLWCEFAERFKGFNRTTAQR